MTQASPAAEDQSVQDGDTRSVTSLLRNEPAQQRSNLRLVQILDAAAEVVHESGYERLTTALVGERSHSSIGTVYRYFPDRLTILQALAARNLATLRSQWLDGLTRKTPPTWLDAVDSLLDYQVAAFRDQPSFRSLRYGDTLDVRPAAASAMGLGTATEWIASALLSAYDFPESAQLRHRLEVALTLADALLARAFRVDDRGEERIIQDARTISRDYLVAHFGDPRL